MPRELQKNRFTGDLLRAVQDFSCGMEAWERQVADWIKAPLGQGGALDDMVHRGCEVWVYSTVEDGLIGYGSLGASNWKWPLPESPRVPINIIPYVGIQQRFWGQPDGPREGRFSSQILDDLIFAAMQHPERQPLLGLFVDDRNARAIRVYENAGFVRFHIVRQDPATGATHISMLLNLPTGI